GPWPTPVRARPVQWRPGSIRVQPSTLEEKDWPSSLRIDPNFQDNSTMEWLLEDDADVVVTALMVRELGPCADPEVYGPLAARVREDGHPQGPESHWLQLRAEEHRLHRLTVDDAGAARPWRPD
ncbi:unnamed protein product, partial [Prorocentrum cordatum]